MRFVFVIAFGLLLSAVVVYTVLGLVRLARLLVRSDIFAVTVALAVALALVATLPQFVLIPEQEVPQGLVGVANLSSGSPLNSGSSVSLEAREPSVKEEDEAAFTASAEVSLTKSAESVSWNSTESTNSARSRQPLGNMQPTSPAISRGLSQEELSPESTVSLAPKDRGERSVSAELGHCPSASGESVQDRSWEVSSYRWANMQPSDWVGQQPFYLDDSRTLVWPIALGPYVEPLEPMALGELRRKLSAPWVYWFVEQVPQRSSPELANLLFSFEASTDRERPWNRKIRWLPPELWNDLLAAASQAIASYAREELGVELPKDLDSDWIAENFLRDVYWELVWPSDLSRPVLLDDSSTSNSSWRDFLRPVKFRVHVLLAFDDQSRAILIEECRRAAVYQRTVRLLVAMGAFVGAVAIGYIGLRAQRRATGRRQRLWMWGMALGIGAMVMLAFRALSL